MTFYKKYLRKFTTEKTAFVLIAVCAYILLSYTVDIPFSESQVKKIITKRTTVVKDNADGEKTQKSIYYYDSKNRMILNKEYLRKNDIPASGIVWEYGKNRRVAKQFLLSMDQNDISSTYVYTHYADSAIIITQENADAHQFRKIEYYDRNNNVVVEKTILADQLDSYTQFRYNSKNEKIEEKYYRAPNELIRHSTYVYDKNGDVVKMNTSYSNGDKNVYEYIYTKYDLRNNWLEGKVLINGEHFWNLTQTVEYR